MRLKSIISILCCICLIYGQTQVSDTLKPIDVIAKKDSVLRLTVINSNVPHYIIDQAKLNELLAIDIGDALKFVPGANIKDYGGLGGLKTISYRSLGASHTSISADGLILPNAQTGVVNLNLFDVFGTSQLEMTAGQPQDYFATASAYLKANLLALKSTLLSEPSTKLSLKLMNYGTSINNFQNGISLNYHPGHKWAYSLQGLYGFGTGIYPFTINNVDSSYTSRRQNANINTFNLKTGLRFRHKNSEVLVKAGFRKNDQELPGAIILYNPYTDQNLMEEQFNASVQFRYTPKQYAFGLSAFFQDNTTIYTDHLFLNAEGLLMNQYHQQTLGSGFILNRFLNTKKQRVFIGSDFRYSQLHGNQFDINPDRQNFVSVVGISKWLGRVKIQGHLTHQFILDQTPVKQLNSSNFSPFLAVGYLPFKDHNFRIRAHFKNTYRMPSFNDLYYNFIGNTGLSPEEANTLNLGLTYGKTWLEFVQMETTLDMYHNIVDNKIVAIPTKNLFNWSMQNIGKTKGQGFEFNALISLTRNDMKFTFSTGQSVNSSTDITTPGSTTFGHQIPYTPIYTASYGLKISYKQNSFIINALYSGGRYTLNENIYPNFLPGYADISTGIAKKIPIRPSHSIDINIQMANILNNNYEIIRSFPMPGRHLRLKIIYQLKS